MMIAIVDPSPDTEAQRAALGGCVSFRLMSVLFTHVRLALAVGFAFVGLLLVGVVVGRAAQKPTASQLLHAAFADASARGSMHESQLEVDGGIRATFSDDVAGKSGRQKIDVNDGVHAKVLVAGSVAYISGNQKALVSYFGLPKAAARSIGKGWVRIPSSNSDYTTVATDATLPSALSDVTPSGDLAELPARKLDGESVVGIRGRLPSAFKMSGSEKIYLTRSTHPLPLSATFTGSAGQRITFRFGDWGERVGAKPPANPIPIGEL